LVNIGNDFVKEFILRRYEHLNGELIAHDMKFETFMDFEKWRIQQKNHSASEMKKLILLRKNAIRYFKIR